MQPSDDPQAWRRRSASKPMDLADATLVAFAEEQGLKTIFTLDDVFPVYGFHGRQRFEIIPAP